MSNRDAVMKDKATEPPFSGILNDNKEPGVYVCGQCGAELFRSSEKFDSGSGWPSFTDVANAGAVETVEDTSLGMVRTEVVCKHCGGHLGHVFDDGPKDATGLRYCINSASLDFHGTDGGTTKGDGSEHEHA